MVSWKDTRERRINPGTIERISPIPEHTPSGLGSAAQYLKERVRYGRVGSAHRTRVSYRCHPTTKDGQSQSTKPHHSIATSQCVVVRNRRGGLRRMSGLRRAHRNRSSTSPTGGGFVSVLPRSPRTSANVLNEKSPIEKSTGLSWSGKRDSNPRRRPWQGRTLPLSYSRSGSQHRQACRAAERIVVAELKAVKPVFHPPFIPSANRCPYPQKTHRVGFKMTSATRTQRNTEFIKKPTCQKMGMWVFQ